MKKILIDVDEVICINTYLDELNAWTGKHYTLDDFNDYYIDRVIESEEERNKFNSSLVAKNLYKNAKILPNAVKVIEKLSKKYEVYILSSFINPCAIRESGKFLDDKYQFLLDNFPFLKPQNFIFAAMKNIIKADIQIDDKLKHLQNDIPVKLMFTAYHNKNIDDETLKERNVKRVNSWQEIEEILL